MPRVPQPGDIFTAKDLEMVFEAVKKRQENFQEPADFSFWTVMSGIGERFRKVSCEELEWEGLKSDVPKGEGVPTCPNGHRLVEGPGVSIGWVAVE